MARDNPRCLPPTRTLRRIRWPLQPRSRDHPTAFGDVMTAERRSHAVLGLARSRTVSLRRESRHHASFRSTRTLTCYRQTPRRLGPRSLVPPRFLARCVRAYSRPGCCLPTSATAYDVRAIDPGPSFPRRDGGHDHLPFLTHHARPSLARSGDTRRAAHSSVRSRPRCRFLLVAQVCPTAISRLPRHLHRLATTKFSAD
jgi:hypothetical protein